MLVFGCDLALGSAIMNLTCVGCDPRGECHFGRMVQLLHSGPQVKRRVAGGGGWGGAPARPGYCPR